MLYMALIRSRQPVPYDLMKAVAGDQVEAQIKDLALYGNMYSTGLQVGALSDPAAFLNNYNTFLLAAASALLDNTAIDLNSQDINFAGEHFIFGDNSSVYQCIDAYARLVGYNDDIGALAASIIPGVIEGVIDLIVGEGTMNEALAKLRNPR